MLYALLNITTRTYRNAVCTAQHYCIQKILAAALSNDCPSYEVLRHIWDEHFSPVFPILLVQHHAQVNME
jgi:hypothetical protein